MKLVRWAVFISVALLFNFPMIATIATSLKTNADIYASPPLWIFTPTLQHYEAVVSDQTVNFPRFLGNSVVIALLGTVFALALSLPAAYAVVRFGVGKRFLLPIITNLRTIPLIIFAIPFYLMFQLLGLLDTRVGLAFIACLINLPLALVTLVGFMQDFPLEIDEAARVDGATTWQVLLRVLLPLSSGVVASVAILSFIYAWNEFLFGLILTTQNATPVTVGATLFITSWGVKWGQIAAAMTLSALPPALLGALSYRYLAKALTSGAVKG
jgi:multiple sugar transport system permease protein